MPYGMTLPKAPACPQRDNGKHKWTWTHNGFKTSGSGGSLGSAVHISARGIYVCTCGKQRYGAVNHNAPGADVRDHVGSLS